MMKKHFFCVLLLHYVVCLTAFSQATDTPDGLSNTALVEQIKKSPIRKSGPFLETLVQRIEALDKDAEANVLLPQVYFLLTRYHFNEYINDKKKANLAACVEYAEKLTTRFPAVKSVPEALTFAIDALLAASDWPAAEKLLKNAIAAVDAGRYPNQFLTPWVENLCRIYAVQEKWGEGASVFKRWLESPYVKPEQRAKAAFYIVRGGAKSGNIEGFFSYLPYLAQAGDDRYDPELNLDLFKVGNKFSDEGKYDYANYMYFLTIPIEDSIAYYESKSMQMRAKIQWYNQNNLAAPSAISEQLNENETYLRALRGLQSYTGVLKYKRAANLRRMGREYDAFYAYYQLVKDHPEDPMAEVFCYTTFEQAFQIKYQAEAIEIGEYYLTRSDFNENRAAVVTRLIGLFFAQGNYSRVEELGEAFVESYPNHPFGANVVHFLGYMWMRQNQVAKARERLTYFIDSNPRAPLTQTASYWLGIACVYEQDFAGAIPRFDFVINKFSSSGFFPDALFRRAVCEFGLGDYGAAKNRFEAWVERFPNHNLRGEAHMFLGDIAALHDQTELALSNYKQIEDYTNKISLIDHGYFESATLLEAADRHLEIVELMKRYMERFNTTGNLPTAILTIGRAYEATGQPAKMLHEYKNAIAEYGNERGADGVDQLLTAYISKYSSFSASFQATLVFINRLLGDAVFRHEVISDRGKLHSYGQNNPVEYSLIKTLLRDKSIRDGLVAREIPPPVIAPSSGNSTQVKALAPVPVEYDTSILPEAQQYLYQQRARILSDLKAMPELPPLDYYRILLKQSKENKQRTFVLRLAAALSTTDGDEVLQVEVGPQDIAQASAASLVWMASISIDQDRGLADLALAELFTNFSDAAAVPDALRLQAAIHVMDGKVDSAIQILDYIGEQHPTWERAEETALLTANLLFENQRFTPARERYLKILNVRDWRGEAWAEASVRIGQCYEAEGEYLKAHGFYERGYLAYSQYPQWAGRAYYLDGLLLMDVLNEAVSAREVFARFLQMSAASAHPDYESVKKQYEALENI
ncbi:MAG: TolA-binding protein [Lentimonas sp.]|jgi:TolA-binding protein